MENKELIRHKVIIDDCQYVARNVDVEPLKNSTILITGIGGFLGFNFLHNLIFFAGEGIKPKRVIGVDNFLLRRPEWLSFMEDKCDFVEIEKFDIANDDIGKIISSKDVDYIIHLASIASPSFYRKHPVETIDANVWGLRNLLEFFKDRELKSFLFFSSSEIYGDPLPEFIPTPEHYRGYVACTGPRACYDEAKRFGETLCYVFNRVYDTPIKMVRPFNNYGPGMDVSDRRVVADFAKSILENKNILIHSDGSPTRTFCYVADAMIGYWKAIFYERFDVFNIGIDKPEISVKELAEIYEEVGKNLFDFSGDIILRKSEDKEYLIDNPNRRCPDITKAKMLLGYNPTIDIYEGIKRYLMFLKEVKR
jgi:UDP-glucuronate decarboxylase